MRRYKKREEATMSGLIYLGAGITVVAGILLYIWWQRPVADTSGGRATIPCSS